MSNATFSNISAISWRPVLVVEEVRVPGENHLGGSLDRPLQWLRIDRKSKMAVNPVHIPRL
jgi:hypothetical protein